jgi:YVTN family beta-propeller protein
MKLRPSLVATSILLLTTSVPGFQPPRGASGLQRFPRPARQSMLGPRVVTPKGTPINGPAEFDPPLPEIPFPNDPPDIYTDPFDPITDLPLPEIPDFPPEIPFPDDPLDDIPIPDPPELDDPFPDLPSLDPGDIGGYTSTPANTNLRPAGAADFTPHATAQVATNVLTPLMPYPRGIFFLPGAPKVTPPRTLAPCNPATASNLVIPETGYGTVYFFNLCTSTPKGTHVPVGGQFPTAVVVSPDGTIVYVAVADIGQVVILDLASKTVTGRISLPQFGGSPAQPNTIRIAPDGSRAYVGSHVATPNAPIYVIDLTTNTVIATIPVGAFPACIELTPDGSQLWVTSRGDSNMTIIDTMTNTIVTQIQNVPEPTGIAFNPTGTIAYVAEGVETGGRIDVYNTANYQLSAQIPVGNLPHVVRVTPSGRFVFVTNALSNSISLISAAQNKVIQTIPIARGIHPLGITFVHR